MCNFYAKQGMQEHLPNKSFTLPNLEPEESSFENKLDFLVTSVYQFKLLHPKQKEAITYFMNKKDTCIIMPTGFGKSLCYWTAAILHSGLTVVFEPLIALIQDQMVSNAFL
jgi:superfamily II DNA helicase RecQ